MPNTILTPQQITREAARILHQKATFISSINRSYDDSYAKDEGKIGSTLKIRLPNQYTVRTGASLSTQDTSEQSVDLTVATQKGVDLNFSSAELTLSLDDFSKRIIEPAMSVLAANIEADAMSMYKDVYQSTWNNGSAVTLGRILGSRKILQDSLAPLNNRTANLNTQDNVDLIDNTKGLFNATASIAKQYTEGYMGNTAGMDFMESSLWANHTRGAASGAYTTSTLVGVLATNGTAYSSITVATGTGAANVGDVFTIANVFKVHPESKANTGILQQFVVTNPYAGGAGSIAISPAIVLGGARQNCVIPTTSATAAITWAGTASTSIGTSLVYQKDAFAFVSADLILPKGVDFAYREVIDNISIRIVRAYNINDDTLPCRLDILYGYKAIRPQLAVRLHNN